MKILKTDVSTRSRMPAGNAARNSNSGAPKATRSRPADPIEAAVEHLRLGEILAVKGLGGFHLAADAVNPAAVERLRERKRRVEKPFAVMVRNLEAAAAILRDRC